ncbi:MAG: type II secretion system protein, partial [Pseudobdellovibrionaceae bacterium]
MISKSKNGFTMVEVMVGMAILVIAMISGLVVLQMVERSMKSTEDSLGYVSARNQLVSLLLDDTSWGKIVANNAKFSCLLKQNSAVLADRDC